MTPLQPTDPPAVGEFRLLGRLGAGGMGRVYLGVTRTGRPVAVKVIKPEIAADPAFRSRFVREVAAARQVGGFWTASVVAADPAAESPWLATEYVPGMSLRQAVEQTGPLPAPVVRVVAARLAEALAAIHAAGLVHRDLKPANVLLAPDGPKVIDFGIARAFATETAGLTSVIGTPSYMAPEQIQGQALSPATDVFSLGSTLVYAARGRGPFNTGAPEGVIFRVVAEPPDLAGVPAELVSLVAGCLAKDPAQRPTTDQLLAELAPATAAVVAPYGGWRPPGHDPAASFIAPATQVLTPPPAPADPAAPAAALALAGAAASQGAPGPTSRTVRRALLPQERFLAEWREHGARLAQLLGAGMGLTALLGLATGFFQFYLYAAWFATIFLVLGVGVAGWTLGQLLAWRSRWFVRTDQRLLAVRGVLRRRLAVLPLAQVVEVRYEQTRLGRLLHYGTLVLARDAATRWEVRYVPDRYVPPLRTPPRSG